MLGKKLCFGDTIGIVAPASCDDDNVINEKIEIFKSLGFKIKKGRHLYDKYGYLAGKDKERADDLNEMFANPKIKAIICYRGGYGSIRMLKYLDLSIIKKNPKIFCGFSDITLILNYLYKKCNLITFHGPMINSKLSDPITKESLFKALVKGTHPYNIPLYKNCNYYNFRKATTSGILVGGNLSLICNSLKTPYEIDTKNKILLIEDVSENIYSIDRMLNQLIYSKKLLDCKGIILGYFTPNINDKQKNNFSFNELIKKLLIPLKKPIITNFPSGHEYPNITLPIGSLVEIDSLQKKLSIKSSVVK